MLVNNPHARLTSHQSSLKSRLSREQIGTSEKWESEGITQNGAEPEMSDDVLLNIYARGARYAMSGIKNGVE